MLPGLPRRLLAFAGSCLLVAACATPSSQHAAPRDSESFPYRDGTMSLRQRGAECEVTLSGEITPAAVSALSLVTADMAKRNCGAKWLVLDNVDGQVGPAITIGSMLRNRGFNTRVAPGSTCLTPCLIAFAAGTERHIPPGPNAARVGFSQLPPDEDYARGRCETALDNRQLISLSRYLRAMLPDSAGDLVMRELRATDCRGVRPLPTTDAMAAGLVTRN
ncbi:hypothetical protein [Azoarcus sp. KH32C]|uniref:COG3904 family protein n=1 Tax=Azoarcus sp. KH32C TaxID=748247 RepID=UPI0002386B43|nr:hypothetical protein [Azoarcus sp. KH32C]BAL23830.1 hypothetical protein AZKH_1509 [Azoarcus sp. KH32C]